MASQPSLLLTTMHECTAQLYRDDRRVAGVVPCVELHREYGYTY
jgi:hypothetical protein